MPYKCVHCSELYSDGSEEILKGCSKCNHKFFFYIRKEQLEKIKKNEIAEIEFEGQDKEQVEKDVRDIAGLTDEELPVFLDFESVRIVGPGKYVLDLGNLFATNKPRVYKLEDGKYIIDLSPVNKLPSVEE